MLYHRFPISLEFVIFPFLVTKGKFFKNTQQYLCVYAAGATGWQKKWQLIVNTNLVTWIRLKLGENLLNRFRFHSLYVEWVVLWNDSNVPNKFHIYGISLDTSDAAFRLLIIGTNCNTISKIPENCAENQVTLAIALKPVINTDCSISARHRS